MRAEMAAVNDTFVPLVAETPPATGLDAAGLQAVALAFGMDPNSKNELLKPDENFLQVFVYVSSLRRITAELKL